MPTVSLVHTKGGVAKTTSAVYLATAAHRRGRDVVLVDADPQGSALEWAAAAQDDPPLPFPVVPARRPPLDVSGRQELTIVDTPPPGTAQVIQEAIELADLVVVPTGGFTAGCPPGMADFGDHRTPPPTAVLLTGVDLRTRLADEVKTLLEDEGVPVIETRIVRREGIRRASGLHRITCTATTTCSTS